MLTVDDLRQHLDSQLGDEALERLLGAAYEAIDVELGAGGDVTEVLPAGPGDMRMLSRPAGSILSVTEYWGTTSERTLALDDYRRVGDQMLVRLDTGTTPAWAWCGRLEVVFMPADDEATRDRVAIALVKLDASHSPGLMSQKLGDWSETYQQAAQTTYEKERTDILTSLRSSAVFVQ